MTKDEHKFLIKLKDSDDVDDPGTEEPEEEPDDDSDDDEW